jgi:hypothetical protein
MLKGDLATSPLAPLLLDLAAADSTGSLVLKHPDGAEAQVFLRGGLVCGISATDRRSDLGAKLVSSGALAPEALAEALEAQRNELSDWNLGELLVHLGYVDEDVIQDFVIEQLNEAMWDLLRWTQGTWKFRKNAKTREDAAPPQTVVDLLESLRERGYEWETISNVVQSPTAIPMLSARGDGAPEMTLDSDAWSMLCKIDGTRSVAELADDCGYTLFEAGQVLVTLVEAGLVDVSDDVDLGDDDVYGAGSALAAALAGRPGNGGSGNVAPGGAGSGAGGDDALARLSRLASEVAGGSRSGGTATTTNPLQLDVMAAKLGNPASMTVPIRGNRETFAAAMGRVSGALADVLGPAPADEVHLLETVRKRPQRGSRSSTGDPEWQRRKRLRAAAAAELAEAQAAAEMLRPDRNAHVPAQPREGSLKLVDLERERARVAAREAEEAARHAAEGAAREAAEEFARAAAEQAARLGSEGSEREADRLAAEHAERVQAERQAAEEAARLAAEEAEREAAERAEREAAERAEREAAERAEREAAERAEREAAERAEREAAERAEREAAERAEREAAEREAAEQAEREAIEEAARLAAEESARLAAEEAEREAAEFAEREATERAQRYTAEEAAQLAAELAEQEAPLAAAERSAAEEAARLAAALADQEAADRAAIEAAAVVAAEEAAQLAAFAEADRLAREEAEAAALSADQAAAATAMLVELHHAGEVAAAAEPAAVPVDEEPEPPDEPELLPLPNEATDTAALLRELSSLGVEDADRPAAAAAAAMPRAPRPASVDPKKAKKKIGLFGL